MERLTIEYCGNYAPTDTIYRCDGEVWISKEDQE